MKQHLISALNLAKSKTALSTYLTTFGSIFGAGVSFLFWIMVARVLKPADYGNFSAVFNLINVLFVVCDIGLSSSILKYLPHAVKEGKEIEARKIIKSTLSVIFIFSGVLTFALFAFSQPLSLLIFNKTELSWPLALSSFALFGLSLSYFFVNVLQGKQKFLQGVIAENSILVVKVSAAFILFTFGKLNLVSLLVIFSVSSFAGFFLGLFFEKTDFIKEKFDKELIKKFFSFGIWIALARIANSVSSRIDLIILMRFVDPAQIGYYAAAQRVTFIFPVMINGMTVVLNPKYALLKTRSEILGFTKKAIALISLAFIPLVVLFLIAPWLIVFIFGQDYYASIRIFQWLLISAFFFIALALPTIIIVYSLGKSRFFAYLSIFQLILTVVLNLWLIPVVGILGSPIALATVYAISLLVSIIYIAFNLPKNEK
jgi:O-antigen/teichoic acid export membrane protein